MAESKSIQLEKTGPGIPAKPIELLPPSPELEEPDDEIEDWGDVIGLDFPRKVIARFNIVLDASLPRRKPHVYVPPDFDDDDEEGDL